jgi:hypothetical protein
MKIIFFRVHLQPVSACIFLDALPGFTKRTFFFIVCGWLDQILNLFLTYFYNSN